VAKYGVTYSCGHSGEVTLFGPGKERDRKLEWLAREGSCRECFLATKKAEGPEVLLGRVGDLYELQVVESYDHREALKARGYRFSRDCHPRETNDLGKLLLSGGRSGWVRRLPEADARAEITWAVAQGWRTRAIGAIESCILAVVEGRPEMVPPAEVRP
jgi:hypothetical protein